MGGLAAEVAAFVTEANVAAKSIGVEYLESLQRLVVTLGYTEGETYPVELVCEAIGKIDAIGGDFSVLEKAMTAAAAKQKAIICHELYVTRDGNMFMVFMLHRG